MNDTSEALRRKIREAAGERARLHALGARSVGGAPELAGAYAASREFITALTGPEALARLGAGDPEATEHAVCFLEVYPLCPDSGFAVRDLVRVLKRTKLSGIFRQRIQAALLAIVALPPRDEAKHLRQLALALADEAFVLRLDALTESPDPVVHANALFFSTYLSRHREGAPWSAESES